MKQALFESTPFMLTLVVGCYLLGIWIYKKTKITILHPCLICMILIIPFLKLMDIPYESFKEGNEMINFMLGTTVVALGFILYDKMEHIKENFISKVPAITIGSLVCVLSVCSRVCVACLRNLRIVFI